MAPGEAKVTYILIKVVYENKSQAHYANTQLVNTIATAVRCTR